MAQLPREYSDQDTVTERTAFELIPAGTNVEVVLTESAMKATKAANGHYLALTFVVTDGPFENRKLFENLNLDNPSEAAVQIAEAQFFSLRDACGKKQVSDSEELHGIPVLATIGIQPAKGDFDARNKITKFSPLKVLEKQTTTTGQKAAPWSGKK